MEDYLDPFHPAQLANELVDRLHAKLEETETERVREMSRALKAEQERDEARKLVRKLDRYCPIPVALQPELRDALIRWSYKETPTPPDTCCSQCEREAVVSLLVCYVCHKPASIHAVLGEVCEHTNCCGHYRLAATETT